MFGVIIPVAPLRTFIKFKSQPHDSLSADAVSSKVARLSRLALTNMASAVSLYVKSGIAAGTAAPVPLASKKWWFVWMDKNPILFLYEKNA